ncbi:MAG: hypothetical protein LBD62_00015 [Candidatus Margulisbacteria bacterium]|jgi:hypothetical protein|nr:hypothetical protein [Candidatus Margulisiibacteriota bacterium]
MARILHAEVKSGERLLATDITDLTFFPKGTILTFSSIAWGATSAEFKTIWKVCNAANHAVDNFIPDLTGKFLRGAESSGTAGGADSQSVTAAQLPEHNHGATGLSVGNLSTDGLSINQSGGHAHTVSGSTGNKTLEGKFSTYVITDGATNSGINIDFASGILSRDYSGNVLNDPAYGERKTNISGCKGVSINATHSHDVNINITESGSHSHTITGSITGGSITGSTASTGSGSALTINTVPVYYTVIYIIKAA